MSNRALLPLTVVFALASGGSRAALGSTPATDEPPALAPGAGSGPPIGASGWPRVCSQSHRFCVWAPPRTADAAAFAVVSAADRAWDALVDVVGLQAPEGPLGDRWAIYLVDGVDSGARAVFDGVDPRAGFERGASFALVDRVAQPSCALDVALARAIAQGSLWRSAPETDVGSARAEVEALAHLACPCAPPDEGDVAAFQERPESSLVDPTSPQFDRGAATFFDWLDSTFGREPGSLLAALWALTPARSTLALSSSADPNRKEKTGFDVLRVSLRNALGDGSTLDDVLVKFAVARTLRSPAARMAWVIPWPTHARRLASPRPIFPTGASYVSIDRAGAPRGSRLRVEAEWEDYARMRWVVLKIGGGGRLVAQVPITSLDHGTHAAMTVDLLDGVERIVLVAENLGSTEHPFDPAQGEWEPHGWLLTVSSEE